MEEKKITYKLSDTGHWLARCDHSTGVIELNRRDFFNLSPMLQDYIWIHEWVHLKHDVYDEAETNRITDKIFISRAKNEKERLERISFVVSSGGNPNKSNMDPVTIGLLVSLGTSLIKTGGDVTSGIIAKRNSGYYSLSESERVVYIDNLLSDAFMASLLTDKQSAKDIFWSKLLPYIPRKNEQTYDGWYANNKFVTTYIAKYESQYGFEFGAITPVNPKRHPQYQKSMRLVSLSAIGLALLILMIVLLKTKK